MQFSDSVEGGWLLMQVNMARMDLLRVCRSLLRLCSLDEEVMSRIALSSLSEKHRFLLRQELPRLIAIIDERLRSVPHVTDLERRARTYISRTVHEIASRRKGQKSSFGNKILGKDAVSSALGSLQKLLNVAEGGPSPARGDPFTVASEVCESVLRDSAAFECWSMCSFQSGPEYAVSMDRLWVTMATKIPVKHISTASHPMSLESFTRQLLAVLSGVGEDAVTLCGFAYFVQLFGPFSEWHSNVLRFVFDCPFAMWQLDPDVPGALNEVASILFGDWGQSYASVLSTYKAGTFVLHLACGEPCIRCTYVDEPRDADERDMDACGQAIFRTDPIKIRIARDNTRQFEMNGRVSSSLDELVDAADHLSIPFDRSFVSEWFWPNAVRREAARGQIERAASGSFAVIRMLEGSRVLPELCLIRKEEDSEQVEDVLITKRDGCYVLLLKGKEVRGRSLLALIGKLREPLSLLIPLPQGGVAVEGVARTTHRSLYTRQCDLLLSEMKAALEQPLPAGAAELGLLSPKRDDDECSSTSSSMSPPRRERELSFGSPKSWKRE